MTYKEFVSELKKHNLSLVKRQGGTYSIGSPEFANPLIIFNPSEVYNGSVVVKSINASLFSSTQVTKALAIVDRFLYTQPEKREMV